MHVAAVHVEVHIPHAQSLKEKRHVLRPFVEGLRRLASLSVSEVDHHDTWQRAGVGIAIVAPDAAHLERLITTVRTYLDTQLELSILDVHVTHMELD